MNRFLSGIASAALFSIPAAAQDAFVLDDIVFSANFSETDTARTGAAVSVVTEDELERTEDVRVIDYLRRVPGVSVRTSGPPGTQAGITIRGVSQQNVAVRIDGIDVSDPSGTQVAFDFGGLTVGDISRIEVLRGSQAARFGSETIGGVIDITTRRAERNGFSQSADLETGSNDTFIANYGLSHAGPGFETNLSFGRFVTDGFSAADEANGNREADGFGATRLSLAGSYDIGQDLTLEVAGFVEESAFDYDESSGCPAASPVVCDGTTDDIVERDQSGARVALIYAPGAVEHTLEASWFLSERRLTGTSSFGPFDQQFDGARLQFSYRAEAELGDAGRVTIGAEQVREDYTDLFDFGFGPSGQEFDATVNSVFGEYAVAVSEDVDLAVTLRHDDHSRHGDFWSARVSGVYRLSDDLLVRANLANGYRAPSPYELFDIFAGNPDLDPETSISFDIGAERRLGDRGAIQATLFFVEAEDIIDFSFGENRYVQRDGTSTRRGIELGGSYDIADGWIVDGAYTYTDSFSDVTLDSSGWTLSVPRHTLSATVSGEIAPRWTLALAGEFQADRPELDDFAVFDSTVAYEITDGIDAYLRVENLLDTQYQTVPGYGTSDRAFYVGLRASF